MLGQFFEEMLVFLKKGIYIFNVKCGNSYKAELHSEKILLMPSIERKLCVQNKNGNNTTEMKTNSLMMLYGTFRSKQMLPLFCC